MSGVRRNDGHRPLRAASARIYERKQSLSGANELERVVRMLLSWANGPQVREPARAYHRAP
ncbi:hypothetical protein HUW62_29340 [Myxococcus sp. AM011]|uniref:hypothetical protein n=1 Tax=unclassified Myxococcus TaxID=2648731 RepID=UPI00159502DE|nr:MULTISPECIES: hypothetical protein [unclassified Myxococcus]NVJ25336.1 hypothetical protein [Myxococcus sp. AM011]